MSVTAQMNANGCREKESGEKGVNLWLICNVKQYCNGACGEEGTSDYIHKGGVHSNRKR